MVSPVSTGPESMRHAHSRGHELVAHGWDPGEYLYMLTREQERGQYLQDGRRDYEILLGRSPRAGLLAGCAFDAQDSGIERRSRPALQLRLP